MQSGKLLSALLLGLCSSTLAAVHPYSQELFYSVADAYIYRGGREGLYASTKEALEKWGNWGQPGAPALDNGQSEIKFTKLEFSRPRSVASQYGPDDGYTGLIQAVLFEVNDRDLIGHPTPGGYRYCCTKELVPKTKCFQDRLIYQEKEDGWPKVVDIYFKDNDTVAFSWEEAITIEETGLYYLWFVICDPELSAATVSGSTIWKNPTGFLPGMMLPHTRFFGVMSLAYLALGAVWGGLYIWHWVEVFTLQHCISGVIALSMMEMSTWYFDYINFNATGYRPYVTTLYAVLLGCLRKTLSRLLVLIVAMGFGVVLPYLGAVQKKIIALGVTYIVAVTALDVVTNVGAIDDLTSTARIVLVLPVAVLDGIFILWVFTSLSKTLAQLQTRRAGAKLDLYRRFTNTLALMVWASVAWIAYEMYFKVTDQYNLKWRWDWITADFWHVQNLFFLCIICFLFRPSFNSTRYAYSEQEGEDAGYVTVEGGQAGRKGEDAEGETGKLE
ncbi:hypothetical protein WJX81_007332 [Elliptochloris bilobata]|uniref:GOST seven transmembrane domain-containing protein n=1 Tax=Elliptochloris bilobata TaxID=381761 RepID=A0AAW1SJK0_9CHLO